MSFCNELFCFDLFFFFLSTTTTINRVLRCVELAGRLPRLPRGFARAVTGRAAGLRARLDPWWWWQCSCRDPACGACKNVRDKSGSEWDWGKNECRWLHGCTPKAMQYLFVPFFQEDKQESRTCLARLLSLALFLLRDSWASLIFFFGHSLHHAAEGG